jgi:hypothetical protein
MSATKTSRRQSSAQDKLPPPTDWRTTDADELLKRQVRAREETFRITNLDPANRFFPTSPSSPPAG